MKVEGWLFLGCGVFLAGADIVYWYVSKEPTGTTALALAVGRGRGEHVIGSRVEDLFLFQVVTQQLDGQLPAKAGPGGGAARGWRAGAAAGHQARR